MAVALTGSTRQNRVLCDIQGMPTTNAAATQRAFQKLDSWRGESAANERTFQTLAKNIESGSESEAAAAAAKLAQEVGLRSKDVFLRDNIFQAAEAAHAFNASTAAPAGSTGHANLRVRSPAETATKEAAALLAGERKDGWAQAWHDLYYEVLFPASMFLDDMRRLPASKEKVLRGVVGEIVQKAKTDRKEIEAILVAESTWGAQVSDSDIPDPKVTPFHAKLKKKLDDEGGIYTSLETVAKLLLAADVDDPRIAKIAKAVGQSLLDAKALKGIEDGIKDAYYTYFDHLGTRGDYRDDARIEKVRQQNNWSLAE
jgi:hypothetical protein